MGDLIGHGPACAFCSSVRGPASCPARPPARPHINSEDHAGDDRTPTTEDVRLVYGSDRTGMLRGALVAAFDRYLAAHDAEIREQIAREIDARASQADNEDYTGGLAYTSGVRYGLTIAAAIAGGAS